MQSKPASLHPKTNQSAETRPHSGDPIKSFPRDSFATGHSGNLDLLHGDEGSATRHDDREGSLEVNGSLEFNAAHLRSGSFAKSLHLSPNA